MLQKMITSLNTVKQLFLSCSVHHVKVQVSLPVLTVKESDADTATTLETGPAQPAKERQTLRHLRYKILFGVLGGVSGYFFVTLVTANYLVFSNSNLLQSIATYFLTPPYFVSTHIFHVTFDEGIWAAVLFMLLLGSICGYEAIDHGIIRAVIDTVTLTGPLVLFIFELGVYIFIPSCFYIQVVNFVTTVGLGHVLTNAAIFAVTGAVLGIQVVWRALKRFVVGK
jgi:hypothetical protein